MLVPLNCFVVIGGHFYDLSRKYIGVVVFGSYLNHCSMKSFQISMYVHEQMRFW